MRRHILNGIQGYKDKFGELFLLLLCR